MGELQASEEERTWRRRLASRANNRAWSLAEQQSRTPAEDLEMVDAAHSAMFLWRTVGNARNFALAQLLLGHVHALLDNAQYALPYAEAAHAYFGSNTCELWEMAMSHAVLAAAAHRAGNPALHESNYSAAFALIAKLPSGDDRSLVEATMKFVPKPDITASR